MRSIAKSRVLAGDALQQNTVSRVDALVNARLAPGAAEE
jgi:hypothetical protein